jgi:hypothetical protein
LLIASVAGWSRVPEPPARMMPLRWVEVMKVEEVGEVGDV